MKVKALQQIYASVEAEQSPSGRGGFQTLFYTHGELTASEVQEIEARLFYFSSEQTPTEVKRVFFTTQTGKYVVAQVSPLLEADKLGRSGRSLAHAFIFTREAFEQVGNNPFTLFACAPFVNTVEEALQRGDFQSGDIPAVELEVSETQEDFTQAQEWPPEALKQMILLALQAREASAGRSTVMFIGEPHQVEQILKIIFSVLPAALRPFCTFDTYFKGGNLVATHYWAIGLSEPLHNPRLHRIEVRSRCVESRVEPKTLYERWVTTAIEAGNISTISREKEHGFALCKWLEGHEGNTELVDSTPATVVEQVFSLAPEQVRRRLLESLRKQKMPALLARRCCNWYLAHTGAPELLRSIRTGFRLMELMDVLEQAYHEKGYRAPSKRELQALETLLKRSYHRKLRLLYLCWVRNIPVLQGLLEGMSEGEYREFVQLALSYALVEAHLLIVPGKQKVFLEVYESTPDEIKKDQSSKVERILREYGM
ncbi:MAG: hypothetical protein K6U12_10345 [Armatimonadetes bacterium]|nr:hypothetical protein [Armatimonadota bacterium]